MLLSRSRHKCSGHAEEIKEVRRSALQESGRVACGPAQERRRVKSIQTSARHSFSRNKDSVILMCSPPWRRASKDRPQADVAHPSRRRARARLLRMTVVACPREMKKAGCCADPLLVPIHLLPLLVPLLRLDRERGDGTGFEPLQRDRLAGFLAIAVGVVLDALQC
jgi:hypothetical protein